MRGTELVLALVVLFCPNPKFVTIAIALLRALLRVGALVGEGEVGQPVTASEQARRCLCPTAVRGDR
jgi:hypothetical protein